ncbi:SAV_915 family protein [Streptomyces sp. NPDC008150]|uniref:SAV_915 family protein n=1 Tax=Streptomyces sp. NPDC008150 TaxID=3364816 RepID=UPI0036E214B9
MRERPVPSRLLDFLEPGPPRPATEPGSGQRRSRLLDYAEATPAGNAEMEQTSPVGAGTPADRRPPAPAYSMPVCVPAHPRYVDIVGAAGQPDRVAVVTVELFGHPAGDTVVFAFSSPSKLAAALGPVQPWIAASIGPLTESVGERGIRVLLDPRVAPGPPNWLPADLAAYAEAVR